MGIMAFMRVANLEVFFDKEFYKPFEEVLVKILLTAKRDIFVNSLVAKIYGIREIKTVRTIDIHYSKNPGYEMETLFEEQKIFLENEVIIAGEHEYYLSYRIPMMNIKKVEEGGYQTKFFVNTHVDIPWAIDLDIRQRFLVLDSDKEFEELKRKVDRKCL
jgi:hypothetical protein